MYYTAQPLGNSLMVGNLPLDSCCYSLIASGLLLMTGTEIVLFNEFNVEL